MQGLLNETKGSAHKHQWCPTSEFLSGDPGSCAVHKNWVTTEGRTRGNRHSGMSLAVALCSFRKSLER